MGLVNDLGNVFLPSTFSFQNGDELSIGLGMTSRKQVTLE